MNTRLTGIFTTFFLLLSFLTSAQYIQVNDNYSAQQLVEALVGNSCASTSNIVVNGWSGSSGSNSYGYFTSGNSGFPFQDGIVLSTGFAASAPGPNNTLLSEGSAAWGGDPDLDAALSVNGTINATVLEFDFVPFTNRISFDYIFASEQYLTSITSQNQCNYTDGFAFLLKEAGAATPYQNLAVVPGTDIPVKVNTVRGQGVCPAANEQYFGGFNPYEHPVNFNGQTVILKAEADVVAGVTYHIKLVVADQGNNLYDSAIFLGGGSFNSTTDLGIDRLITTDNPACNGDVLQLNATTANAAGYQWFENGVQLTGENNPTLDVTDAGQYSVKVQLTGNCISQGNIIIEYAPYAAPVAYTLLQCDEDNDGSTVFNLKLADLALVDNNQDLEVSYHITQAEAESNTNGIANPTQFENTSVNQVLYARVANQFGCFTISQVTLATSANGLTNPSPLSICDTYGDIDGISIFDLTSKSEEILQALPPGLGLQYFTSLNEAFSAQNPIIDPANYINTTPNSQTLYTRVFNGSECYGIAELELVVFSFGSSLQDESVTLCAGELVTLTADSNFTQYSWNTNPVQTTRTITVSAPGNYAVEVTDVNGCTGTKTFVVNASGPVENALVEINDFAGTNNSITIYPEGTGHFEFSLDGLTYQSSPVFESLYPGEYIISVRDRNGCGPVYTQQVYVLDYPKFFTPNGDGINDTWRIPYLNKYPQVAINIFDRYGKAVARFDGSINGWDGTFQGELLPSTDYWFAIRIQNGRIVRGHFAMIR